MKKSGLFGGTLAVALVFALMGCDAGGLKDLGSGTSTTVDALPAFEGAFVASEQEATTLASMADVQIQTAIATALAQGPSGSLSAARAVTQDGHYVYNGISLDYTVSMSDNGQSYPSTMNMKEIVTIDGTYSGYKISGRYNVVLDYTYTDVSTFSVKYKYDCVYVVSYNGKGMKVITTGDMTMSSSESYTYNLHYAVYDNGNVCKYDYDFTPQTATYTGGDNGIAVLTITEATVTGSDWGAYTPKSGDTYVLTYNGEKISWGTITIVSDSIITFTSITDQTFTAVITVTITFDEEVPTEEGDTILIPPLVPPGSNSTRVGVPTANPDAGAVASGTAITLSTATTGASIYYTIDGMTAPNASTGTLYIDDSKPTITVATTIKAIAVRRGMTDSEVLTAAYTISGTPPSPPPGSYTVSFNTNGGSAVASQTVAEGSTVAYPEEPTKAEFYFDGWYDSTMSTPYNYGTPINASVTLHAKWLTEEDMIAKEFSPNKTFEVYNTATWNTAKSTINEGGTGKNYAIKVTDGPDHIATGFSLEGLIIDETFTPATFTPTNTKVLIYAPENKTIRLSSTGNLFYCKSQTLILRSITLQGQGESVTNTDSLVRGVVGSALIMRPGAVLKDNKTSSYGGGVYSAGSFTMSGGTISSNTASTGGGVYIYDGTFKMSGGTISDNTNTGSTDINRNGGGGVYTDLGTFEISGGTISGNTSVTNGGGVNSRAFTMNGGTISGNRASIGGGVYENYGTFTMNSGTISGNTATNGGGVYATSTFRMRDGAISGNTALSYGGGIYNNNTISGTFTMSGGTVYGSGAATGLANTAAQGGASLANTGTAKYGDGSYIVASNETTDETLVWPK
jgi:hypothetical protein